MRFGLVLMILCYLPLAVQAGTIAVGLESGCDYTDIQRAINSANPDDVVEVKPGTYYGNIFVDKPLTIVGIYTGDDMPILDAVGTGNAVTLSANGITLKNFVVTNSGFGKSGIDVKSDNNLLIGNSVIDNRWYGINIESGAKNNKIYQNSFYNNGHFQAYDRGSDNHWDENLYGDFYERDRPDGFYKISGGRSVDEHPIKPESLIYQTHNRSFDVPVGWGVESNFVDNGNLSTILSDGDSTIRIDVISIPYVSWLMQMYNDSPWDVTGSLESYYREQVLGVSGYSSGGSGLPIEPDGGYMSFRCAHNCAGWTLVWTKPEYVDKFVGVHAVFNGDYPKITMSISGSSREYSMEEPLYGIITSYTTS